MQHSFDISIAQKYGVNVAIFLNNMAFWIQKNVANNKHFNDGHHWTYNSQDAFIKLFPYWTRQNLRTIIKSCIDEKLIITGNYNTIKYDRTTWYALTETGLDLFPTLKSLGCNQPVKALEQSSPSVRINQAIPDINTDIKPDKKSEPVDKLVLPKWLDEKDWNDFKEHRKNIKKPLSITAEKRALSKLEVLWNKNNDPKEVINESIINGWSGLFEIKKASTPKYQPQEVIRPKLRDFTQERLDRQDSGFDVSRGRSFYND